MPTPSGHRSIRDVNPKLVAEAVSMSATISGHYEIEELDLLFRSAMTVPAGGWAVEIGVWGGRSSSAILQAARLKGFHVDLVDPFLWIESEAEPIFAETARKFTDVDYKLWKTYSSHATQEIKGPIDFIHIDGDHQSHGLNQDCLLWLPKVAYGGLVAFHDYGDPGLPEVKRTVDKIVKDESWKFISQVHTLLVVRKT